MIHEARRLYVSVIGMLCSFLIELALCVALSFEHQAPIGVASNEKSSVGHHPPSWLLASLHRSNPPELS
jgi:hypothetical protein